jgi:hypothetical protein
MNPQSLQDKLNLREEQQRSISEKRMTVFLSHIQKYFRAEESDQERTSRQREISNVLISEQAVPMLRIKSFAAVSNLLATKKAAKV